MIRFKVGEETSCVGAALGTLGGVECGRTVGDGGAGVAAAVKGTADTVEGTTDAVEGTADAAEAAADVLGEIEDVMTAVATAETASGARLEVAIGGLLALVLSAGSLPNTR